MPWGRSQQSYAGLGGNNHQEVPRSFSISSGVQRGFWKRQVGPMMKGVEVPMLSQGGKALFETRHPSAGGLPVRASHWTYLHQQKRTEGVGGRGWRTVSLALSLLRKPKIFIVRTLRRPRWVRECPARICCPKGGVFSSGAQRASCWA